jgi:hypothetical protein
MVSQCPRRQYGTYDRRRKENDVYADTTVGNPGRQFGRRAIRAMVVGLVAIAVLGAGLHGADAKPYNAGQISLRGFVDGCNSVDGTVFAKGSVVKCSFPNGASESCNFKNPKSVICNYVPLTSEDAGTHGPLGGALDGGQDPVGAVIVATADAQR